MLFKRFRGLLPIGLGLAGAAVTIIYGIVKWKYGNQALATNKPSLADLGNLGSYLQGTTGSFWALAGVIIIFVAFLAQMRQLQIQQQQFERQSFETAFFQLLNLFTQIPSQLRITKPNLLAHINPNVSTSPSSSIQGRACFREWFERLEGQVAGNKVFNTQIGIMPNITKADRLGVVYSAFYAQHEGALGHYFRNLYHLLRFVKTSNIDDKRGYVDLVKGQLSAYELVLLHYHCVSPLGEQFRPLVEEFGLLESLDRSLLFERATGKEVKP